MALDLTTLNASQEAAVMWDNGPLLVLAGPGSGKTRVLTVRIARLIEASPKKRFRILGLTFTTKAADEMRTRIETMIGEGRDRVQLATFHSFAADVLRQHGSHIGYKPDFVILHETGDREAVFTDAIRACAQEGIETDESDVKLLPLLDRLLDNCTSEEDVRQHVRDPELADKMVALFSAYRHELARTNRVDFPCLLAKATELLETLPGVAKLLRTTYTRICVDEFQDTNRSQYRFLRSIVGNSPSDLFVVADDDQIIYQWNGADPERLTDLRTQYRMGVVQLPANYRCPPAVIGLANKLIRHNHSRSPEKEPLVAVKIEETPSAVRVERFDDLDQELGWLAADIARRAEPGHSVVLGRTRKLLEGAVATLVSAGVKAVLHTRKDEFETAPFRWLHSVLRLANARGDREQVRRVCKAFYGIEGLDIRVEQVVASAAVTGGDFLRAWFDEALARNALSDLSREFLTQARVRIVTRMEFLAFIEVALSWFDRLRGDDTRDQEPFADLEDEAGAWRDLRRSIVERLGQDDATLEAFLHEMDLSPKSPPPPADAVRCMTIHGAKGMEFEHVYLVGLVEDQLPSFQAVKKGDDSRELQEERRNCFVAITRAQESLTLTYAGSYWGWSKAPSRFLNDMELLPTRGSARR